MFTNRFVEFAIAHPIKERRKCLACNKRPVAMEGIARFIDELERELIEREAKEVQSGEIGERVMRLLRELDEVAYVRRRCLSYQRGSHSSAPTAFADRKTRYPWAQRVPGCGHLVRLSSPLASDLPVVLLGPDARAQHYLSDLTRWTRLLWLAAEGCSARLLARPGRQLCCFQQHTGRSDR